MRKPSPVFPPPEPWSIGIISGSAVRRGSLTFLADAGGEPFLLGYGSRGFRAIEEVGAAVSAGRRLRVTARAVLDEFAATAEGQVLLEHSAALTALSEALSRCEGLAFLAGPPAPLREEGPDV